MNEVAESSSDTPFSRVQSTTGFAEIGDGREFAVDGTGGVPAGVEVVAGGLRVFFVLESGVNVSDQVCKLLASNPHLPPFHPFIFPSGGGLTVVVVVTDHHLLHLSVLAHFAEKVLIEGIEVGLQLDGIHLVLGVEGGVLV